jgi:hypothetical protein
VFIFSKIFPVHQDLLEFVAHDVFATPICRHPCY